MAGTSVVGAGIERDDCCCGYWAGENEAVEDSVALEKAGTLAAPVPPAAEDALG